MLFYLCSSLTLETLIELLTVTSGWSLMNQRSPISVTVTTQLSTFQKLAFSNANVLSQLNALLVFPFILKHSKSKQVLCRIKLVKRSLQVTTKTQETSLTLISHSLSISPINLAVFPNSCLLYGNINIFNLKDLEI